MTYYIRPMQAEDIRQVSEIDREAFPTMLPSANFHRELQNRLAHYLVACDAEKIIGPSGESVPSTNGWLKVTNRVKQMLNLRIEPEPESHEYIAGFLGIWLLVDEAHITSIAVRDALRRQGIGELLLISAIELAMELKAQMLTLEVRISNNTAQSLYRKYGFAPVGVRKGYYSDNYEDGLLMSTESLQATTFVSHFQELKETHVKRRGMQTYQQVKERLPQITQAAAGASDT